MSQVVAVPSVKETEVLAKAKRRGFTAEYKQRILNEVDAALATGRPGEVGAILRREGLYSSHLAAWRRLRDAAELAALNPRRPDLRAGRLEQVEECLARAVAANLKDLSGSCADIPEHKQTLWTFVDRDDVEPTNNHAERELRAFVRWRKRSFDAQSERGNLFAERVMTVAHTARKQDRNVLAFLASCCTARLDGGATPSPFAPAAH